MRAFTTLTIAAGLMLIGTKFVVTDATAGSDAVAYQVDVAHSGRGNLANFTGKLKELWSETLGPQGGWISYPLIVGGVVYVTTECTDCKRGGTILFALDASTGATVWEAKIPGSSGWSNAAYDNGKVFVVGNDDWCEVRAFDAQTGAMNWKVFPGNLYFCDAPPTALNGQVFVAGASVAGGGLIYSLNETDGSVQWSQVVFNGDHSSPAIGGKLLFVSYPCQYYGINTSDGSLAWSDYDGCEGAPGHTPVYFDKSVYVRDRPNGFPILDAKTGKKTGKFHSYLVPSFFFDNDVPYRVQTDKGELLDCIDVNGSTVWSFAGDGYLSTAPITVGKYVIEGSILGNLYVLDGKTGKQVWSANVGAPIFGPDEIDTYAPVTGLAAANGILVVPENNYEGDYSAISAWVPE